MFAKDLVKKILVLDPTKRFTIQQILAHPWFKQNTVQTALSSSPQKQDQDTSSYNFEAGSNTDLFKSYVQERIAESIMPGNDSQNLLSPAQEKSKFSGGKNVMQSAAYSFTPEELAQVIRP